jgi:hypothetical protein
MDSKFCNTKNLVIQITPEQTAGEISIHGKKAHRMISWIFLPKLDGNKIFCPLNYFQDCCSIPEKWILDDTKNKITLDGVENFEQVIISLKKGDSESEINIPKIINSRLLDYFNLGLSLDGEGFEGFDCHAFVCYLLNIRCVPEKPNFYFSDHDIEIGDIIVLCDDTDLPNSVKHWALKLDDDAYISKFGQTGNGSDAHVAVMDLDGMMKLFDSSVAYRAVPKEKSHEWDGEFRRKK